MTSSNYCFLTCIQISQEAGQVVWYSHHSQNFPQFIVIHTVKGFGIVNKAEIDVFLELSCFFHELGKYFPLLIIRSRISVSIWMSLDNLLQQTLQNYLITISSWEFTLTGWAKMFFQVFHDIKNPNKYFGQLNFFTSLQTLGCCSFLILQIKWYKMRSYLNLHFCSY